MKKTFDLNPTKTRKVGYGNIPTQLVNENGILSVVLDNNNKVGLDKLSRKDLYAIIKATAETNEQPNVNESVTDLIDFGNKYGEENLGTAVYNTLKEDDVKTLNDLARGVWEYEFFG